MKPEQEQYPRRSAPTFSGPGVLGLRRQRRRVRSGSTGSESRAVGPALQVAAPQCSASRGAILLEVVLSLVLLFSVGAVMMGALSNSIAALRHMKLEARGADLAVTVLSRMQMGLTPVQDGGPTPFEDEARAEWTWQVVTAPMQVSPTLPGMTQAEIVIANESQHYAYRLVELFPAPPEQDQTAAAEGAEYE